MGINDLRGRIHYSILYLIKALPLNAEVPAAVAMYSVKILLVFFFFLHVHFWEGGN